GTARRVLRTKVPDPFSNQARISQDRSIGSGGPLVPDAMCPALPLMMVVRANDEGQGQAFLVLVLAFLVGVAGATSGVGTQKQDLCYPFAGIDLGRQRRGV